MAEENTTASTSTTDQSDPTKEASSTSSTTEQTQAETQADDEASASTILTEKPEEKDAEQKDEADTEEQTDEQTDEQKAAEGARAKLFGAPEGDYELTGLPEGTIIDAEALAEIAPIAKEIDLSNEGLSRFAGVYAEKILPRVADQLTEGLQRDIVATHKEWADQTTKMIGADKAFEGKKLADVQQIAAKALDRFGGEDFRKFCDETGLGNHPALVKFAYLAGSAISEDTTFERGGHTAAPKSRTEKYYPNST